MFSLSRKLCWDIYVSSPVLLWRCLEYHCRINAWAFVMYIGSAFVLCLGSFYQFLLEMPTAVHSTPCVLVTALYLNLRITSQLACQELPQISHTLLIGTNKEYIFPPLKTAILLKPITLWSETLFITSRFCYYVFKCMFSLIFFSISKSSPEKCLFCYQQSMVKGLFKNHNQFSMLFLKWCFHLKKKKKGILVFRYTSEIEANFLPFIQKPVCLYVDLPAK